VVAADLQERLAVSGYTVRRDLDEMADAGIVQRVHGGALARSPVSRTYAGRSRQERPGKRQVATSAARLFAPGETAILDGGSTALALVAELPEDHEGTVVTHSLSTGYFEEAEVRRVLDGAHAPRDRARDPRRTARHVRRAGHRSCQRLTKSYDAFSNFPRMRELN